MIIYRPHRGSLSDAMSEARVFSDEDEMKRWIVDDSANAFGKPLFSVDDIVIGTEIMADSRNGWNDTRYVCVKRYGSETFPIPQCIGMCATEFSKSCSSCKFQDGLPDRPPCDTCLAMTEDTGNFPAYTPGSFQENQDERN